MLRLTFSKIVQSDVLSIKKLMSIFNNTCPACIVAVLVEKCRLMWKEIHHHDRKIFNLLHFFYN